MYTEGFHPQRTVSMDLPGLPLPVSSNYYPVHRGRYGGIGIPVVPPYQMQYPINLPPVSEEAVYGYGYGPGQQQSIFPPPYKIQYPINLPSVSEEAVYGYGYGPSQQQSLFPQTIWSPLQSQVYSSKAHRIPPCLSTQGTMWLPQEPQVDTCRAPPVPPSLSSQGQCTNEQQWVRPLPEETQENSIPREANQFGFGTSQSPRVMIFHPKSPMANFLGNFSPGEYVMEIRVSRNKNEPFVTSSSSSDSALDNDAGIGQTLKKDKERMKLIIH